MVPGSLSQARRGAWPGVRGLGIQVGKGIQVATELEYYSASPRPARESGSLALTLAAA